MFSPSIEGASPKGVEGGGDCGGGKGGGSPLVKSTVPAGSMNNNMQTPNGKKGSPQFKSSQLKSPQLRSSLAFSPKAGMYVTGRWPFMGES